MFHGAQSCRTVQIQDSAPDSTALPQLQQEFGVYLNGHFTKTEKSNLI